MGIGEITTAAKSLLDNIFDLIDNERLLLVGFNTIAVRFAPSDHRAYIEFATPDEFSMTFHAAEIPQYKGRVFGWYLESATDGCDYGELNDSASKLIDAISAYTSKLSEDHTPHKAVMVMSRFGAGSSANLVFGDDLYTVVSLPELGEYFSTNPKFFTYHELCFRYLKEIPPLVADHKGEALDLVANHQGIFDLFSTLRNYHFNSHVIFKLWLWASAYQLAKTGFGENDGE